MEIKICGIYNLDRFTRLSGLLMRMGRLWGIVYYQRLRHMVSDKSQVRAMVLTSTHTKPVKVGKDMVESWGNERDSLCGISFLLHDRLVICSEVILLVFLSTRGVEQCHHPPLVGKAHSDSCVHHHTLRFQVICCRS